MATQVYTSYLMSEILIHSICTDASQEGQGRAARGKVTNRKILLTGDFTQLQQLSCLGNNHGVSAFYYELMAENKKKWVP